MKNDTKDLNRYAKTIFLFSIVLLLAGALLYLFGVRVANQEKNSWSQTLGLAEMQVNQLNLRLIDEAEKMQQTDVSQYRRRVPDKPEIKQMIAQLEEWEKASGLSLNNLTIALYPDGRQAFSAKPNPPQQSAADEQTSPSSAADQGEDIPWSVVEMTIEFSGTMNALDRFIKQAENSHRLIRLIHMNYEYRDTGDAAPLNGNMVLHAYYSEAFHPLDNISKEHVYSK